MSTVRRPEDRVTPEEADRIVREVVETQGVPQRFLVGPCSADAFAEATRHRREQIEAAVERWSEPVAEMARVVDDVVALGVGYVEISPEHIRRVDPRTVR